MPQALRPAGWLPAGCGSQVEKSNAPCSGVGWRVAPRMRPLAARRRAVGRSLELGFRRQARAAPSCVRRGLGVAHVDRPRRAAAAAGRTCRASPTRRRAVPRRADGASLRTAPRPSRRDATTADRRSRLPSTNSRNAAFVTSWRSMLKAATSATAAGRSLSQPNTRSLAVEAERGAAGGHRDPFLSRHRTRRPPRCTRPARCFCSSGSRCHMYSSVSWCIASCSRIANAASARSSSGWPGRSRSACSKRIEHLPVGFRGKLLNASREPAIRPASVCASPTARPADSCGSMPRANSVSSRASMLGLAQPALHERVEAEGRQMALVEHNRMPQRDRTAVVGVFADQIEKRLRPRAVASIPVDQGLASHC